MRYLVIKVGKKGKLCKDEVIPFQSRLSVNEVLGHQSGQEGEAVQRRGQVKSKSSVHGVVRQEVVLLKEHGVQGVQHLEGGGKGDHVIDGTSAAHDVFKDQDDVNQGHANEREPIGLQL